MLNRWQRTIVDLQGNVVPYAQIQVRVEQTQAAAIVYADIAGNEPIPNGIVTADANGYAYFYAEAGLYRISSEEPTIDWRHVDIGSANAVQRAGTGLTRSGATLSVDYGTTEGTVAEGNDSRITGAMQKSANLADVDNAETARDNLGLGTMATRNVTTSTTDPSGGVAGDIWLKVE